ncbi:hypothetical protein O7606_03130 [Micromonospora sp. WMMD882]|uniref:hypothetical protein n=1 Tax=Micromonospora sp. WMMD882 TaxID=3015151 RepID=UPI00248B2A80|nr:hypothetical protein [Micromonospora sp. WMMD882]WBB80388.1 hypothetical protein O7606_03130 [Micromonospora sp. WMMD882]
MTGRALRGGLVVALTAAGTVTWPVVPAVAAGSAGYCPDASGVTVVVDFNELGGGTVVRCARGEQATGLAALKNAGFQVAGTLRWGEGFVCRIDGKPSAAAERCVDTPPASAYWSYWHAPDGGGWTYSDKGVANRRPSPGGFEGWSFSLNRSADDAPRPGVAPLRPTPPAPPPPPPPTGGGPVVPKPPPADGKPPPPTAAGGGGPGTGGPGVPGPGGGPGGGGSGRPEAAGTSAAVGPVDATPPGVTPGDAPGVPSGRATDGPAVTGVAAGHDGNGPPLGTVVGAALLAALAAGGLLAARRRRHADPDG